VVVGCEERGEDVRADLAGALDEDISYVLEDKGRGGSTPMRATLRICVVDMVEGMLLCECDWRLLWVVVKVRAWKLEMLFGRVCSGLTFILSSLFLNRLYLLAWDICVYPR
jgi:hypothetical protein